MLQYKTAFCVPYQRGLLACLVVWRHWCLAIARNFWVCLCLCRRWGRAVKRLLTRPRLFLWFAGRIGAVGMGMAQGRVGLLPLSLRNKFVKSQALVCCCRPVGCRGVPGARLGRFPCCKGGSARGIFICMYLDESCKYAAIPIFQPFSN
jgi:hypothetical protein